MTFMPVSRLSPNPPDYSLCPARPADAPNLGVGVGLRTSHYAEVLERGRGGRDGNVEPVGVDWFELLSENYMVPGGRPLRIVREMQEMFPLALHGVSLNIGSSDPLRPSYLDALDELARLATPSLITDHLCWTGVSETNLHDLMPLPYTDEVIAHVAGRVRRVQDRLGRRIALENVSSYLSFNDDAMTEWDFLTAIAEEADCGILLDINNVFVSAHNHGFDAMKYIDSIPAERVFQIHLAGHSRSGSLLIDTHDHAVTDGVWTLFERAIKRLGPVSTLIEWDDEIPTYARLLEEADKARAIIERVTAGSTGVRRDATP
jgi:uncharacterized protein (UPF0276 family)